MTLAQRINGLARQVPTWPIYVGLGLVPFWWLYLGFTGGLGVEPIKALEHRLGELGLQVLIASLCITPLRRFFRLQLIRFRRALGLMAFYLVALHLLVWLVLDVRILSQIWTDIVKRPYITVGMAAFLLLVPLALTSNAWSIRRLGPQRWQGLHRLVYPAVLLGAVHWVMLAKGWQWEPLAYLGAIVVLLLLRLSAPALVTRAGRRA
jgi:sulfoxide reductase heme-binding subunit YedZ